MAEKMRAGTYKGHVEHLRGQRATLRVEVDKMPRDALLAQFDKPVTLGGRDAYVDFGSALNEGWHAFPADDFDIDIEYEEVL